MFDSRILTLLSEAHAEQQARARLWLLLDMLTDMSDARTFCDVLADVATLHAQHRCLKVSDRARWRSLAESAHQSSIIEADDHPLKRTA